MKKIMVCMILTVLFVLNADAFFIRNETTGTVLMHETFEDETAVSSAAYQDTTGDYNPAAGAGWSYSTLSGDGSGYAIQVTDYGTPGAYEGDQYLRLRREGAGVDVEVDFADQTTAGQTIHFETMINCSSTAGNIGGVGFDDSANQQFLIVKFDGGNLSYKNTSAAWIDTGLDISANAWQKMELDWVVGASTATLSINGSSATEIGLAAASSDVAKIDIFANSIASEVYLDSVVQEPEPATVGILLIGAE